MSAIGAPHLVDPSRLEQSARRLYGESFDVLWGELAPVPEKNVHVVGDRVLGLDCFPTQGHASHHVCYLDADGTLYAGDAAGVSARRRATPCCRRRRRRRSTSTSGKRRSTRSHDASRAASR